MPSVVSQEFLLVKDGQPLSVIVRSPEATKTELFAAQELQHYLKKITDAEIPITTAPASTETFHIILGAANKLYGFSGPDLEREGFLLRTEHNRLHVMGANNDGLLFAVYTLLEDYCGVRWFWPGELGEVIPKTTTLVIPVIRRVEVPDFKWRNRGPGGPLWGPHDRITKQRLLGVSEEHLEEVRLWEKRTKWGGLNVQGGHEWGNVVSPATYGHDHPEYYALVDGRRDRDFEHFDGKHGAQLCTTNPDLVPLFLAYFKDYFAKHPECDALHVTPNDGGGFCECDHCRALDTGKKLKRRPDKPVITERIFTFANTLAEELQRIRPGKRLVNMAYSWYVDPPQKLTISDHVIPQYCMWSCYLHWNEQTRDEHYAIARGWTEAAKNVGIYEYYINGAWPDLPRVVYPKIAESLRYLYSIGIRLYQAQAGDGFAINGLNYYIAAKLLWNVDADVDALIRDFYKQAFGKAAKWVRRYYERFQEYWQRAVTQGEHPSCSSFATTRVHQVYPSQMLQACRTDLEQARKAAGDPQILRRITFIEKGLTYTELTLQAVELTKQVEKEGITISSVDFNAEEELSEITVEEKKKLGAEGSLGRLIKRALDAWEKRDRYVETLKDDFVLSYFWIKYNDENRVFNPTSRLKELLAS